MTDHLTYLSDYITGLEKITPQVWHGLVAVFSQKEPGRELLLVYEDMPEELAGRPDVAYLDELAGRRLDLYRGPLTAFAALDTFYPGLKTKGLKFYPIEQLLVHSGKSEALYSTAYALAAWLRDLLTTLMPETRSKAVSRMRFKIVQMALSKGLSQQEFLVRKLRHNATASPLSLVAIKAPADFLSDIDPDRCEFIANFAELDALLHRDKPEPDVHWITFSELKPFIESFSGATAAYFHDIRQILRYARQQEIACNTVKRLTEDFEANLPAYQDAERCNLLEKAWLKLGLENLLLSQADTENLVAIWQAERQGTEKLVFRGTPLGEITPQEMAWEELLKLCPQDLEKGRLVTFPSLATALTDHLQVKLADFPGIYTDLGEIFWAIRNEYNPTNLSWLEQKLARTLWLLARDLIENCTQAEKDRSGACQIHGQSVEQIIRALTLYNLLNPHVWRHGYWNIQLTKCYTDLLNILEKAVRQLDAKDAAYYKVLKIWFSLHQVEKEKEVLIAKFKEIIAAANVADNSNSADKRLGRLSRYLEKLLKLLQDPDAAPEVSEDFETDVPIGHLVWKTLDYAAGNWDKFSLIPTPIFRDGINNLCVRRVERLQLLNKEKDPEVVIKGLRDLGRKLETRLVELYMLRHERVVLKVLYRSEIERIKHLLTVIENNVRLRSTLKDPAVILNRPVELVFEIENIGIYPAKKLEIRVANYRGLQVAEEVAYRTDVLLEAKKSLTYTVPVTPLSLRDVRLELELNYEGSDGKQRTISFETRLEVKEPTSNEVIRPKHNPYFIGDPVKEINQLFGRVNDISNILSGLAAGGNQNVLLIGPWKIGKSSVMLAVKQIIELLQQAALPDDLCKHFGIQPEWNAVLKNYVPIYYTLQSLEDTQNEKPISQLLRGLIKYIAAALGHSKEEQKKLELIFKNEKADQESAVEIAFHLLGDLLESHPQQRILLLLDEYDMVYNFELTGNSTLPDNLRSLIQRMKNITWIAASAIGTYSQLYHEITTHTSPLFNTFGIRVVSRLEESAANDLIRLPSEAVGVQWDGRVPLEIMQRTGRHPALIQAFCHDIIDLLSNHSTTIATHSHVEEVAEAFINRTSSVTELFIFFCYHPRTPALVMPVLQVITESPYSLKRHELYPTVRTWIRKEVENSAPRLTANLAEIEEKDWRDSFNEALHWLESVINIMSSKSGEDVSFDIPIFNNWLKFHLARQDEGDRLKMLNMVIKKMRDEKQQRSQRQKVRDSVGT
jgi:hypothetical protein